MLWSNLPDVKVENEIIPLSPQMAAPDPLFQENKNRIFFMLWPNSCTHLIDDKYALIPMPIV